MNGCVVRVYTLLGRKDKANYALEVCVKSLDYYSNWFGIKMPLPKCDLLSVPEFSMGLGFSIIKFFDIFRSKRKLGSDYGT